MTELSLAERYQSAEIRTTKRQLEIVESEKETSSPAYYVSQKSFYESKLQNLTNSNPEELLETALNDERNYINNKIADIQKELKNPQYAPNQIAYFENLLQDFNAQKDLSNEDLGARVVEQSESAASRLEKETYDFTLNVGEPYPGLPSADSMDPKGM